MTFITRLFSRVPLTSVAIAFFLNITAFSANALEKDLAISALEKIYHAQIHSYYSVNGFYNFSANQGDQRHLSEINASVATIDELITALKGELSEIAFTEANKRVQDGWKLYQDILNQNINEVLNTGYPDLRLAGDMASHNISFNETLKQLYSQISNDEQNRPSDFVFASRQSAISIALMMTKYSARSTSTVSQVYTGGDTEITIDSLAKEFYKTLTTLMTLAANNKSSLDKLNSASTKWNFIQPSYLNYNENRVNFIVNLYTKKIINDIESAAAAF